jgi:hypothetical protein
MNANKTQEPEATAARKSLKELAQKMGNRLPIMEGREKGTAEDLLDKIVTIRDFDFLRNDKGRFAVYVIDEDPAHFFFGGMVLTDQLLTLEKEGYHPDIVNEGLPVRMSEKRSKNKMTYTNVETYPQD